MISIPGYAISGKVHESARTVIFRGLRLNDKKPVILKCQNPLNRTSRETASFEREYDISCRFDDKRITRCLGLETSDNRTFIIFEDIGGVSLNQIEGLEKTDPLWILELASQIAEAIGVIHSRGIIHKNINPSHIVFNLISGQVNIIDFSGSTDLTRELPAVKALDIHDKSLLYISPEQTRLTNQAVDYRTDMYSLGITLYQLLTGQLPFTGADSLEILHAHIAGTAVPPHDIRPGLPSAISMVVGKLMAKSPEDRYQSMQGLAADLSECILGMKQQTIIEPFAPGRKDFSEKLLFPKGIYGRKDEIKTLFDAYKRVLQGDSEMILITGSSGTGKSFLVSEFRNLLAGENCFFISGKNDQYKRNLPYASIIDALSEHISRILTESRETINAWKKKILDAVGSNGQVIIECIPDLELITGSQPHCQSLSLTEAGNRFNMAFLNFIQAIASGNNPLILFLDDLQWADNATLNLLKTILSDPKTARLLVLGAFKDYNAEDAQRLSSTLGDIEESEIRFSRIVLEPLDQTTVNRFIADTFCVEPGETIALSEKIRTKTGGNPFFIKEFIKTLHREGSVFFDQTTCRWKWETGPIGKMATTDNMVELMVNKIHYLPARVLKLMMLAACIGNRFNFQTLSLISQTGFSETVNLLWQAVEEELVVPVDDNYKYLFCINDCQVPPVWFKFIHDKVQETIYRMFSPEKRRNAHLRIGLLMLARTPRNALDDKLFEIVNHFNLAKTRIHDPDEKIMIIRLNLEAGNKAMRSAANDTALSFFTSALELLPVKSWDLHYGLTRSIYMGCAQCEYLNGMISLAESRFRFILGRVRSVSEKVEIYHVIIRILQNQGKYEQALRSGIAALDLLNSGIPLIPGKRRVFLKNLKIRMMLGKKKPHDLKFLGQMKDRRVLAIMDTLGEMIGPALIYKSDCAMYIALKMMALTLEYGKTKHLPLVYSAYGAMLSANTGNYRYGHTYGHRAIAMVEHSEDKNLVCKTLFLFARSINHWVQHAGTSLELYKTSFKYGMEAGNLIFSAWACANMLAVHMITASKLMILKEEIETHTRFVRRIRYDDMMHVCSLAARYVYALQGKTATLSDLCGEEFDEAAFIQNMETNCRHNSVFAFYYTIKCQLYFFSGEYEKSLEAIKRFENIASETKGLLFLPENLFYCALSLARIYPSATRQERKHLLSRMQTIKKRFKTWAANCRENFYHKYLLICAETARVTGRTDTPPRLYNRSIQSAVNNRYTQNEAIANECCGLFYLETDKPKMAGIYLASAHSAYLKWGALAKAGQLENKYPFLTHPCVSGNTEMPPQPLAAGSHLHDLLDRRSMLKTFRAISREIDMSSLIQIIMKSIIENAGAQRGVLCLARDTGLYVAAESCIQWNEVRITGSIPICDYMTIPAGVINYTVHTSHPVILADARTDHMFSGDPYFRDKKTISVLCSPILYQGKLKGIIYLENSAVASVFTKDRAFAIDMLSAQAAISLENAMLYARLKESENKYRSIFENAVEGIFQVTRTGSFISANESLAAILGYERADELINSGINVVDLFFFDSRRKKLFVRQLGKTGRIRGFQGNGKRKDGKAFWVSVSARAAFDARGRVAYYEGSVVDISERKKKQAAERQRKAAEAADRAKSIFLANMSHEIRTPLNAIIGLAELSILNGAIGKHKDFIIKINDCASTLLKTIDDILHFSRYEAGRVELEQIHFSISDIIGKIQSLFLHETAEKNIVLNFSISPEIPLILIGDPFRLSQVLINLAANAFKFTEEGRVTIGAKCLQRDNGVVRLRFFVSDTGTGICEADISRLFDAFSQADNSISRRYGGTGLGLAISKKIIGLMNGRIWAKNNPVRGTTFFFEVETGYTEARPATKSKPAAAAAKRQTRLLLVDDNAINREITPGILESKGYTVDVASNGKEAIAKTSMKKYDAVLMDVQMPEMDGFEAARKIRLNPANKDLVIIAMTAHAMDGYRKQCLDAGMTDYIPKLVDMERLNDVISESTWKKEHRAGI